MIVHIPSPLRSYTSGANMVEAKGSSLFALLEDIENHYPGFRFRIINEQDTIREHIRIFVNDTEARDLGVRVSSADVVHIMCALSGGRF